MKVLRGLNDLTVLGFEPGSSRSLVAAKPAANAREASSWLSGARSSTASKLRNSELLFYSLIPTRQLKGNNAVSKS